MCRLKLEDHYYYDSEEYLLQVQMCLLYVDTAIIIACKLFGILHLRKQDHVLNADMNSIK